MSRRSFASMAVSNLFLPISPSSPMKFNSQLVPCVSSLAFLMIVWVFSSFFMDLEECRDLFVSNRGIPTIVEIAKANLNNKELIYFFTELIQTLSSISISSSFLLYFHRSIHLWRTRSVWDQSTCYSDHSNLPQGQADPRSYLQLSLLHFSIWTVVHATRSSW